MEDWERPLERRGDAPKSRALPIAITAVVIAAIGGAAYWYFVRGGAVPETPMPVESIDAGVAVAAGADAGEAPVKPKEEGEAMLRRLGGKASKSSLLAVWLSEPDILQRITAAVRLVARGDSPVPVINFIEVPGELTAIDRGGKLYIDPKSYARYDALTSVFVAIDPAHAASAYVELRPYFESMFAQVAAPGERFDSVLAIAIERLAAVNVSEEPYEIVEKGAIYKFKDPAIESLSAAEKHVIRMGPKNAKAFQEFLKAFEQKARLGIKE